MYDGERASIVEEAHSTSPATSRQKAGMRLTKIGNNIVTGYRELYELSSGMLTKIYDIEEGYYAGSDIYNNFFVATADNIKHYNGDTWEDITPDGIRPDTGSFFISAMYYIDRVLYVVGSNGRYHGVVYRGKHI
jgi:hypothetical protein